MRDSGIPRAVEAAVNIASAAGLTAETATVIHASNRIAVRLLPADVLARVAYKEHQAIAQFEVKVARCLADSGCPVEALDPRVPPRVHLSDGFAVTLWTHYESLPTEIAPPDYARALQRLHAGMKGIEMEVPHFTDRVAEAQMSLEDRARTPEVGDEERALLSQTLESMAASITGRGAEEQLLHGEPHEGNVLNTQGGPVFVDLQTCCRGPVEFDIVHAPEEVSRHYPGIDEGLLMECRILMLAMVTTWRWDKDDRLPNGRQRAAEWLGQMRNLLAYNGTAMTEKNPAPPSAPRPKLLSGDNPQIPKGYGDAPVHAYIQAIPGWKQDIVRRLDALIVKTVPGVNKAVKWNSPLYGMEEGEWFLSIHCFTKYVKVAFFRGSLLSPVPPGESKTEGTRYLDIYEGELEEEQFTDWVKQASGLPGERM